MWTKDGQQTTLQHWLLCAMESPCGLDAEAALAMAVESVGVESVTGAPCKLTALLARVLASV